MHGRLSEGHRKSQTLLLENGADLHSRTELGATPLHSAVDANKDSVVRTLLSHNAEVDALDGTDGTGQLTPLRLATSKSNEVIMRLLLEAGAKAGFRTKSGRTAFDKAVKLKTDGPTRLLLEFGADPNQKDDLGQTPLHYASMAGSLVNVSTLIPIARVQAIDHYGRTVLHAAIMAPEKSERKEVVESLLNTKQIDIDARDTNGWSALTYSTHYELAQVTQILLDAGACPALQSPPTTTLQTQVLDF